MSGFTIRFAGLFLFLLPFQFALSPFEGVDLPFSRVLAPVLFCIWLAEGLAYRRVSIPWSWTGAGLFSFLAVALVSVIFAEEPSWAWRRASFLLSYLPLYLVFSSLMRDAGTDGAWRLSRSFVTGAFGAAVVALAVSVSQVIVGVPVAFHAWVDRVLPFFLGPGFSKAVASYPSLLAEIGGHTVLRTTAFFPDPHMFSFYMGLAFPLSIGLAFTLRKNAYPYRYVVFAIIIFAADILAFSRGGYVGLMTGLIVALVSLSKRGVTIRTALASSVLVGIVAFSLVSVNPVRNRLLSSLQMDEGSNAARLELYQDAIGHILSEPAGFGLGNYPLAVKPTALYREPIYAHNLFLDIATEAGIFASLAFFLAVGSAFSRLYGAPLNTGAWAAALSLSVFFGHALFETPLYSVHVFPALLFFLALPDAYVRIKT